MVEEMSKVEVREFLMRSTRTGKVSTVREDGRPHVAPVWFVLDKDDRVIFTTWHETVKAANLRRDARVSICVDDQQPPFSFVVIEGMAELRERAPDMLDWTTRIARRYMGDELAESYGKRNAVEGELLVRVTPGKIIARKDLAD
jgi:PPOX class probable F420-dependent enzyme